jgi:hypothetical protein
MKTSRFIVAGMLLTGTTASFGGPSCRSFWAHVGVSRRPTLIGR